MASNQNPALLELQWSHAPCWCIDAVEKAKGGVINLVSNLTNAESITRGIYEVHAENPEEFVKHITSHELVKGVQWLEKSAKRGLILVQTVPHSLMFEKIAEQTGAIPLAPTSTSFEPDGYNGALDSVTIFVPHTRALREVKNLLKECTDVRLLSKKHLGQKRGVLAETHVSMADLVTLKSLAHGLSERQLQALNIAVERGYYDSPRKVGVAELAEIMGVDEATYSEHLRKVENRVLPTVAKLGGALKTARG
ncbi:MAG: helix-turn-helix domain-containing protein [Candidatus Micrarchaeota archaeon]